MQDVEEDTDILSLGMLEVLDFCWGIGLMDTCCVHAKKHVHDPKGSNPLEELKEQAEEFREYG
jgi:hypothetical protein